MSTLVKDSDRATGDVDVAFLKRAFELAERGLGSTSPNPIVGAVVVKDGEVVGEGYHERYGGPHAEVNALAIAGRKAAGATLYVTLEPCSVSGNTPPCTDAILSAGISRTVVPIEDPNPDVSGRGLSILREAGVRVECGLMHDEAHAINAPYFKYRSTGLPFTTLKLALSLDGRIAPPAGGPRWTSSPESRALVHRMRSTSDCVMVGIGTVLADDPRLTARPGEFRSSGSSGTGTDACSEEPAGDFHDRQPARLVLDSRLRIPLESTLVTGAREVRTVVACGSGIGGSAAAPLERAGVEVWTCALRAGRLDLADVLRRAAAEGFISVLSEGGASVATSLLEDRLVDRVAFFVAPRVYGAGGVPALEELGERWWKTGSTLSDCSWTTVGEDCLFEANVMDAGPREGEEG